MHLFIPFIFSYLGLFFPGLTIYILMFEVIYSISSFDIIIN
jgi:hypothetical protein